MSFGDGALLPPSSVEMEQSTLASMLIERKAIDKARAIVDRDDFYRVEHTSLFDAICALSDHKQPVDIRTVQEELKRRGKLDAVGGISYLTSIMESLPSAANVEYYANIVKLKSQLRRYLSASADINSLVLGEVDDINQVRAQIETLIMSIGKTSATSATSPWQPDLMRLSSQIAQRQSSPGVMRGMSTGYWRLDRVSCGLPPAELIIIGADPSVGKSAIAYSIALSVGRKGRSAMIFSLDASRDEVTERVLGMEALVDGWEVKTGRLPSEAYDHVNATIPLLYDLPVYLNDNMEITISEMASQCRALPNLPPSFGLSEPPKLGLIVVDYIQLIRSVPTFGKRGQSRTDELGEVSRGLKALAREFNVPVLALSQLKRRQEDNKEPTMRDLRDSGSIEAEASQVWLLHRPDKKTQVDTDDAEENDSPAVTEPVSELAFVIVAKNKNGPTRKVPFSFIAEHAKWTNFTKKT